MKRGGHCVVVSPSWPWQPTGSGVATGALLDSLVDWFDSIDYVGVVANSYCGHQEQYREFPVCFHRVDADASPRPIRFLKAMASRWPATVIRYDRPDLLPLLEGLNRDREEPGVLIIEDTPLSHLLLAAPEWAEQFRSRVIRSENVLSNAFLGFTRSGWQSWFWKWEVGRLEKFERQVLEKADDVWAISEADAADYVSRYSIHSSGIAGVSVDVKRLSKCEPGNADTLIYLGSFDIRKSSGIRNFLEVCWEKITAENPRARLLLAGKGSEQFDQFLPGVEGIGFVEDECEFLSRGSVFLNPQESGSGVKLKSITAMAAGRLLITTAVGIEGIPAVEGKHFLGGRGIDEFADLVIDAWKDEKEIRAMCEAGRDFAAQNYGSERVKGEIARLLEELK